MSEIAEKFGIKQALKDLGLQETNNGTSTGKDFFSNGEVIYAGSTFDDPRTTDNAWIETIVVHFHIEEEFANKINLVSQPGETKKVEWIENDGE